ncbi:MULTISPECIES: universal stress protein [Methanobrevibacter]|uniref:universal stress protein n=1 Tax=Methanobrevibacter TaxID=2172 RepID=UPI0026F36DBB|nr:MULTISPECIES: universal stress protein [Methanobrevibacter]MDD6777119.1 universal stress protein [Methanobacteriaceae archaeon]MDY3096164.1 universal stress protein [Methanobrevibacter sp.]
MYKKILLPTDGSGYANQEIDRVTKLIADDGEIIILSVAGKLSPNAFQRRKHVKEVNEGMYDEAKENAELMAKEFPEGYNIKTMVKTGFPAETINKVAEEEGVELIVISASGKSGLHKFIIGSVAEKVLKTSEIDVLLVHNTD